MTRNKRVAVIIGTRPDALKLLPVINNLRLIKGLKTLVISTSQHDELLNQVVRLFDLQIDFDLMLMKDNQSLEYITSDIFSTLPTFFIKEKIDLVIVQGDTTSSMASATSAFYKKIPIAHVEAGLRTWDKYNPFPEEINRKFIDGLADLLFAPTEISKQNLLKEGIPEDRIYVTGNTIIDMVREISNNFDDPLEIKNLIEKGKRNILITLHRRESFGKTFKNMLDSIKELAKNSEINFIFPVHPNPNVKEVVYEKMNSQKNVELINPLDYISFVKLLPHLYLILTDSGGLQEEASEFSIPVLILREKTERIEGVEAGIAKILGTCKDSIIKGVELLLSNHKAYRKMKRDIKPYGDGKAGMRIAAAVKRFLNV